MSSGFISESALEERRKVRNEQWQLNRKENDPELPPEEEEVIPDHRSLFEKLQEQKLKKQEEWEEAHKLKNMVRGLEDDEVDFLEFVDNTKLQEEKRIRKEESSALIEYRKKVSKRMQDMGSGLLEELKTEKKSNTLIGKKSSQISLLTGAIKRKVSNTDEELNKKLKSDNKGSTSESCEIISDLPNQPNKSDLDTINETQSDLKCVAILPGIGVYTDSSDSCSSSDSDSDLEIKPSKFHRDLTGRIIIKEAKEGGCC